MFNGYIPTSMFLSSNGLTQYSDSTPAMMKVNAFNLVGAPYAMKGISEFTLQHNPSMLTNPTVSAAYASHTGLGMTREQNHYLNTTKGEVDFTFIMTDTYEGTPHSTVDSLSGEIVRTDFENLFECGNWFENLTAPVTEWKKPPYVRVSLGRYSVFGSIKSVTVSWLKLATNGEPQIAQVDFTLKQDALNSISEVAFYEVKGK